MLIAAHLLEITLMIGLPLAVGLLLVRRRGVPGRVMGMGALAYIAAELAHQLLTLALRPAIVSLGATLRRDQVPLMLAAVVGLLSAATQEPARYLVLRRSLPGRRSAADAAVLGSGHAAAQLGITAILVLMTVLAATSLADDPVGTLTEMGVSDRTAVRLGLRVMAWWESSPEAALEGAFAGAVTLAFHLGASTLVMVAMQRGRPWLLVAVLWHSIQAATLAYAQETLSQLAGLGLLSAVLVISVALLLWGRRALSSSA